MTVYEHMSWCQGQHDAAYGECELVRPVGDLSIQLVGVPCDHVRIELGLDALTDGAEVDALVAALSELRPLLDASQGEVNCEAHNHDDDEDLDEEEYDDEDTACDGCGAVDANLLRVHIPAGEDVQHLWWCRSCCEAGGVMWDVP